VPVKPGSPAVQRGFALLIVLWTMVLLALLVTQLTAAGRVETRIAANLRSGAAAEAAADGAAYEALFRLLDGSPRHWNMDGAVHRIRIPNGVVAVQIQNEAGKVNPNAASAALLAALLRNLGADPERAAAVAAAITNWRTSDLQPQLLVAGAAQYRAAGREYGPPGAPFQSLDELGLVLGMTPELLAGLVPHLSIYQQGSPAVAAADPVVLQAIAETGGVDDDTLDAGDTSAAPVVSITADARAADGAAFIRHTVIRIQPAADGRPYQILAWDAPGS
jgi:general secretion pathway protein K